MPKAPTSGPEPHQVIDAGRALYGRSYADALARDLCRLSAGDLFAIKGKLGRLKAARRAGRPEPVPAEWRGLLLQLLDAAWKAEPKRRPELEAAALPLARPEL